MNSTKKGRPFMKTRYRTVIIAGGMFCGSLSAFAQPASLMTPLSDRTAGQASPGNQPLLTEARDAVESQRWTAAEAALARSETVLLNGGIKSALGVVTSPSPAMSYIIQARGAVAQQDQAAALQAIDKAFSVMAAPGAVSAPVGVTLVTGPPPSAIAAPVAAPAAVSAPIVTSALLPGHWQLVGWQYHWVPPDSSYRDVQSSPFIPGHYEYRSGGWVWVAGHYASHAS